jgi:hypothetical protein
LIYTSNIYIGVGTYRGLQIDEEAAAAGISGPLLLPGISAAGPQTNKKIASERDGGAVDVGVTGQVGGGGRAEGQEDVRRRPGGGLANRGGGGDEVTAERKRLEREEQVD